MKKSLLLSLLLLLPLEAFAAKQYHCNGKIQYRPCNQKIVITRPVRNKSGTQALAAAQQNAVKASFKYQKEMKAIPGAVYADIIQAKYQKYPHRKNYGQWRGVVKGNGDIHLNLIISQRGIADENRYMGHVRLKEDQTSFNFISTPPKGTSWTWKILAIPRNS